MRDEDIRQKLHAWLTGLHRTAGDTGIIHELNLLRPSARADLAVINGEFAGFEIKSDADSLRRLPRQISAFNGVFDRISLVTTDHHLIDARKVVPPWWGIIYLRRGEIDFYRRPDENPQVRADSLLWLLRKSELIELLCAANPGSAPESGRYASLANKAYNRINLQVIKDAVRTRLKHRCEEESHQAIPLDHRHSLRYWLPHSEPAYEGEC
jgi:hypothetical protein